MLFSVGGSADRFYLPIWIVVMPDAAGSPSCQSQTPGDYFDFGKSVMQERRAPDTI
jgi:hypothetical protein